MGLELLGWGWQDLARVPMCLSTCPGGHDWALETGSRPVSLTAPFGKGLLSSGPQFPHFYRIRKVQGPERQAVALSHGGAPRKGDGAPSALHPAARPHLRFWYQVFTCVSVRLSEAASSMRSCTLRYFCRSKLRSSCAS